jgi:hypothetical protein
MDYAAEKVSIRFAADSPISPDKLISAVSRSKGASLTPDGVLRIPVGSKEEARVEGVREILKGLF